MISLRKHLTNRFEKAAHHLGRVRMSNITGEKKTREYEGEGVRAVRGRSLSRVTTTLLAVGRLTEFGSRRTFTKEANWG